MEKFRELFEAKKITPAAIVKELSGPDWDMGQQVYVKKGKLVVVESYYYGSHAAMETLKKQWTHPEGSYAKYFWDELGVSFKLEGEFDEINAKGRHKKLTSDGVVGIELSIKA